MFTNQRRMSAVTVSPRWDQRQFSTIVSNRVSLCCNIAFGTVGIYCQIHWEDKILHYWLFCQFFWCTQNFLSQIIRFSFQSFDIIKLLLFTNDLSYPAQKQHSKHLCHVSMLYMSLHETQPDMRRQLLPSHHTVRMWLWKFSMSGRRSLSLSLSYWQV